MRKLIFFLTLTVVLTAAAATEIKHPSLLFTPDRVSAAKKAMKTDTVM